MEAVVNFSRRITPAEVLGDSVALMSEGEPRQYSFAKPESTAQGVSNGCFILEDAACG